MKPAALIMAACATLLFAQGCHKEGPAEKAGAKVDNAIGTDRVLEKGPAQKAGEKLDNATDDTKPN